MRTALAKRLSTYEPVVIETGFRFKPCCPGNQGCLLGDLISPYGDVLANDITRKEAQELAAAYHG